MGIDASLTFLDVIEMVTPGTELRSGIDRILQAKRGALIVISDAPEVLSICTGGFLIDAEFSPQRLSELAKMDGALVLTSDATRIARANVHLMPKATTPTSETGTRHRTAERVARSLEVPVVTVSAAMSSVNVFFKNKRQTLATAERLMARATQALAAVERYRHHFEESLLMLTTLEFEDSVSMSDLVAVLEPGIMAIRIAREATTTLLELGDDGVLLRPQIQAAIDGIDETLSLVVRDYVATDSDHASSASIEALRALRTDEVGDAEVIAAALGFAPAERDSDVAVASRGYRLLNRLSRLNPGLIAKIVTHFGSLERLLAASVGELETVPGVGGAKARGIKDGLAHLVQASVFERFD